MATSFIDGLKSMAGITSASTDQKPKLVQEEIDNYFVDDDKDKKETEEKSREEWLAKAKDPVEIMRQCAETGKDARLPHKRNWDINWKLFNNDYDFSQKAPWQSKNFVATVPTLIRGMKYFIKSALVQAGDFFTVNFPEIKGTPFEDSAKIWGQKILRKVLDDNRFSSVISEGVALSLLESLLVLKAVPVGNSGVSITNESAYNIILDPTGRNRWLIHTIQTDYDLVLEKAEQGHYDVDEVKKAIEEFTKQPEATEDALRKAQQPAATTSMPYRKECVINEFYGDIIGCDGELVMKAASFSVLNEKYLIRKPFPIKEALEHGRTPVVIAAVNPKPKSVYHQALISDISGLANMATELLNLTLDTNLMNMARAFELDVDQVVDPADLQGGIFPGKTFKRRVKSGKPDSPMVRAIDIKGPSQTDFVLFESVKNQIQSDAGFFNEFRMGALAQRPGGRATAREVSERSNMTSTSMRSLAEEIEEQAIVPLLEMVWSNLLQYFTDYKQLEGILPKPVIDLLEYNTEGLSLIFGKAAQFEVKGMSGVLQRYEELEKMQSFAGMLKGFPQVLPMLQPKNILETVISNFGWDRDKWMKSDEELQALMQPQQPGPQGMPGGMPQRQLPPGIPPQMQIQQVPGAVPGMGGI